MKSPAAPAPKFSVENKVVMITGASSGIGAACARLFAQQGARLILLARKSPQLTALAAELREQNTVVHECAVDVRDADAVFRRVSELPNDLRPVDILLNNAGLGRGLDKLQDADPKEFDEVIDTNVKGLLYATRAVLPEMVARDAGHIVNLGSVAGRQAYAGGAVYCASKAAVRMLTECLKHDLLGTRIRVSTVDPGMVETNFSVVRFRGDAARAKKVYAGMTPMTPEDVAEAVLFCVTRPAHVNISEMVLLATDQAAAATVYRRS